MEQIENGMVVGAQAEWDALCEGDIWTEHRTSELVDEFVDDEMAVQIMRWYLEIGENDGDFDKLLQCYIEMRVHDRDEINVDYIESHGLIEKFNEWYMESRGGFEE